MDDERALERWEDYMLNNYLNENLEDDLEARWAYEEDQIDY